MTYVSTVPKRMTVRKKKRQTLKGIMSSLVLPTQLIGSPLHRYPEHDVAIGALCRLRDKYPVNSPEWKALNANSEVINRLGGRKESVMIDSARDAHVLAAKGYDKAADYLSKPELAPN